VFLVRALDYGGAQRQLVTLARALDKEVFDVTVLSFYSGQPLEGELDDSGVTLITLEKQGRWDVIRFFRRLIHQLRLLRPDILHGYLDVPNLLALFLKPLVHARVVWGIRACEIDLRQYDWLFRLAFRLESILSRYPDLIVVNSFAGFQRHVARGFPRQKMVLIPNGIDTVKFKPEPHAGAKLRVSWNVPTGSRIIGTVGRLDLMKDLPVFLQAAARVSSQFDNLRFVCIGSGPAPYVLQLQELAINLGIANKVSWPGAYEDVAAVYNAFDVFCSPSFGEGFPNAIGEALACGVPCVASDVGDSRLLVGDCGVVVPPRDPEALAQGIVQALALDRNEIGREGPTRIAAHFSVQRLARLSEEAFDKLAR
jgi:glycosyltransferase involved in cell wall biosynthesis